jgi:predicted transcriptional regulator
MKEKLTVIVGGDMDADERELLENPEKGMKQPRNVLYVNSFEQMERILSTKKLDLLRYLIRIGQTKKKKSVSTIAEELNRKQEAISRDLHFLHGLQMVSLTREGQSVYASTRFSGIVVQALKG